MKEVLVSENETVTHFVFHESCYYKDGTNKLKPKTFMKPKVPGEISVYRIDNLKNPEIWKLTKVVRKDLAVKARGDMKVSAVNKVINSQINKFLHVVEDKPPHERHANIKGLPIDKSILKVVAKDLSDITKLYVKK